MLKFSELPFIRHFTAKLAISTFLIGFSVFNFGFDQTGYSTIQAMDPFIKRFGTYNSATKQYAITPKNLSILNSMPRLTFAAGIIIGGLIGERFGRRIVVVVMLVTCLIGAIISYLATNFAQVLAGRMLVQMYIGMEGWLVPMYQAEIIPPSIRGIVVISYVFNHIFGSFIMSCITFRTQHFTDDNCWKIPVAMMLIIPSFVLLLCWVIPESPRWLVRKGRDEEALKWLKYIYGSNPDYAPEQELMLLKESLERDSERGSWRELFQGTNRRRTIIIFTIQSLNQLTGQAFATQYGTVFIKSLGTINPYTFTLIANACGCLGPFATFFLIERMGRRNMYLTFGSICMACLIVMGGMGLGDGSFQLKAGIVAMTVLYPLFYTLSFGGLAPLTGSEIPALRLRDKSAVIGWSAQNLFAFLVTFTVPYLLNAPYANLGSKVGFIYGGFCLLGLVFAYFYFPEVKGRSLEEIDEMFKLRLPTRAFRHWKSSDPNSVGTRITEMEDHAAHAADHHGIIEQDIEKVAKVALHTETVQKI